MPSERGSRHQHGRKGKHRRVPNSERGDKYNSPHNQISRIPTMLYNGLGFLGLVFGLTFIIMGSVFMDNCNLDKMIPVWLLIMGIIMIIGSIWLISLVRKLKRAPFKGIDPMQRGASIVISIIFILWFIGGNVWVFTGLAEDPDYGHLWFENGCNKSLFILSLAAVIAYDVFVVVFLCGWCCYGMSHFIVRE